MVFSHLAEIFEKSGLLKLTMTKIVIVVMVVLTCHSILGKTMGMGTSNQAVGALANRAVQTMKKVYWNTLNM